MKAHAIPQHDFANMGRFVAVSAINKHYSYLRAESFGGVRGKRPSIHLFKVIQKRFLLIEVMQAFIAFCASVVRFSNFVVSVQIQCCAHAQYACVALYAEVGGEVELFDDALVAVRSTRRRISGVKLCKF